MLLVWRVTVLVAETGEMDILETGTCSVSTVEALEKEGV
jgi:hypothetical protein